VETETKHLNNQLGEIAAFKKLKAISRTLL